MKMLLSLTLAVLISLTPVLTWIGAGALPAHAQRQRTGLSVPVTPTVTNAAGTVTGPGTLTITRFVAGDAGEIIAVGTIAFPTPGGGAGIAPFAEPVRPTVTQQQGAECPILNLEIGPIHLDLLGLVVDVPNPLVINIVAEPGAGNLLGNLLCAIAGLLDPPGGPLGQLIAALNRLLDILGSI